jgi:hypothetical protein
MSRSAAERIRRKFLPNEIRALFVGESPAGGIFFYRANSKLYSATREAFEAAIPALRKEPDFLGAFKRLGCYLEDLSPVPVNHLDFGDRERRRERRALRRHGIEPLAGRIRPWAPRVVAIVVKDIVPDARKALALADKAGTERVDLPFPARHSDRYVQELTDHVRDWRRRRILLPLRAGHE